MNRRKLIALLNLYIDDEIDAEELALLERTVSEDLEARQLYHQYCRLDSASRLAHRQFRFEEPALDSNRSDRAVIAPAQWSRRFRRVSVMAGSLAACIALVSGGLIVFGPDGGSSDSQPAALAGNSSEVTPAVSYLSLASPDPQSFNSDSAIFALEPAGDGTLVPAAWKPRIELPETIGLAGSPPEAWAVGGGIQWSSPKSAPFSDADPRVYRGSERRANGTFEAVSFQFQK
jgi:hypothetical protein